MDDNTGRVSLTLPYVHETVRLVRRTIGPGILMIDDLGAADVLSLRGELIRLVEFDYPNQIITQPLGKRCRTVLPLDRN